MRAVIQRVSRASVTSRDDATGLVEEVGAIDRGFLVLLGVAITDTAADVDYLVGKVTGLRVFEDEAGKMNLALGEVGGGLLVVSQFTLLGDCRKGRRPGFDQAARPELAIPLYERFVAGCRATGLFVATGRFQTHMEVSLVNDGPVTLLLDSHKAF
jgi:D-aminoacyl-tRNA deacylase